MKKIGSLRCAEYYLKNPALYRYFIATLLAVCDGTLAN